MARWNVTGHVDLKDLLKNSSLTIAVISGVLMCIFFLWFLVHVVISGFPPLPTKPHEFIGIFGVIGFVSLWLSITVI